MKFKFFPLNGGPYDGSTKTLLETDDGKFPDPPLQFDYKGHIYHLHLATKSYEYQGKNPRYDPNKDHSYAEDVLHEPARSKERYKAALEQIQFICKVVLTHSNSLNATTISKIVKAALSDWEE